MKKFHHSSKSTESKDFELIDKKTLKEIKLEIVFDEALKLEMLPVKNLLKILKSRKLQNIIICL